MDLIQIFKIPLCQGFHIPDSIERFQMICVGFQLVSDPLSYDNLIRGVSK